MHLQMLSLFMEIGHRCAQGAAVLVAIISTFGFPASYSLGHSAMVAVVIPIHEASVAPRAPAVRPHFQKRAGQVYPESEASFSVLTYNVAGLPSWISKSDPARNTPIMSSLLNQFDLVLVQEDFFYHEELSRESEHTYVSEPLVMGLRTILGDGLNRFSSIALRDLTRHPWSDCHGYLTAASDCLTAKGFSVGRHKLTENQELHVYNIHLDSGRGEPDRQTRKAQLQQLVQSLRLYSSEHAVIVAGDTNLHENNEDLFQAFLEETNLVDTCRRLDCDSPERIDRVMYRNSGSLELEPTGYRVDSQFVRSDGTDCSDHKPVVVDFAWTETS